MRLDELHPKDKDSLELDDIEVGDEVKVGRFLNSKATVKGFKKDKHNQPILKTTKGDRKLFKPRISKLEINEMAMKYPGQSLAGFWSSWQYCLYDTQKTALAVEQDLEFEDVIIGGISVAQVTNSTHRMGEEYKVGSVAAEKGYGPILYYFGMTKGYLSSDLDVSTDAQKIWYVFANLERHGKSVIKKPSYGYKGIDDWKVRSYGKHFGYAYTITDPLRFKIISYMKQAKTNHQQFMKWTAEVANRRPDEIEALIVEGTQSYVNSKL